MILGEQRPERFKLSPAPRDRTRGAGEEILALPGDESRIVGLGHRHHPSYGLCCLWARVQSIFIELMCSTLVSYAGSLSWRIISLVISTALPAVSEQSVQARGDRAFGAACAGEP